MHPVIVVGDARAGMGLMPRLDVRCVWSERCVTAGGELDLATVGVLAEVMADLVGLDPGDSSVDIGQVTFIDASGLGSLVQLGNQLAVLGATFSVVGATPRHRRLFEIVGLSALLDAS